MSNAFKTFYTVASIVINVVAAVYLAFLAAFAFATARNNV